MSKLTKLYKMSKSSYTHSIPTLDTDSLAYSIPGVDDIYAKMGEMGDYFDLSNYPKDHPLYSAAKIVTMNYIRSDHHQVYSYTTNKIGLSMCDTKRWFDNDVTTFAFGHYKI